MLVQDGSTIITLALLRTQSPPQKKSSSQDNGNFRDWDSLFVFQASFPLGKVKAIKRTHINTCTQTERLVSVTLVNRVSINLIVPT